MFIIVEESLKQNDKQIQWRFSYNFDQFKFSIKLAWK